MMLFSLILIFILAVGLTYCYIHLAKRKNWLDVPNQRSSHTQVVPRGGGLVFVSLWLLVQVWAVKFWRLSFDEFIILTPGAVIVALVAFYDDRFSLSAKYRALAYTLAALISVVALQGGFNTVDFLQAAVITFFHPLTWVIPLLAIFAIVWSVNLFNFMDGIDSLAAIEAIFVLGVGGFFLQYSHAPGLALSAWAMAAAVAGFLIFNESPAAVFMGDVGSTTLGFVIMVMALLGDKQYGIPLVLWLMLYGVFLFDATITLIRRILAGEVWYQAHKLHAYQRLQQSGWSHRQVVLAVIGVNAFLSALAILGFYQRSLIVWLAILALIVLVLLYKIVENRHPMYVKTHKESKP